LVPEKVIGLFTQNCLHQQVTSPNIHQFSRKLNVGFPLRARNIVFQPKNGPCLQLKT